jgi:hypothetical protein
MKPGLVHLTGLALIVLLLSMATLPGPPTVSAAVTCEPSWWTIDGGGTIDTIEGKYELSGTILLKHLRD